MMEEHLDAPTGAHTNWSSVLVARDLELRRLVDALQNRPSTVVIEGEAGVGKTKLLSEGLLRSGLERVTTLIGRCRPVRTALPFGPLTDAVAHAPDSLFEGLDSPVLGALRPLLPEISEKLPPSVESAGEAPTRHLVYRAFAEVLASGQILCVLEDVHWADDSTCDFLKFLAAQFPQELTLVLTYRPEDIGDAPPLRGSIAEISRAAPHLRLRLDRLTVQEVRGLIQVLLGSQGASEEFAAFVHEMTGGLPFAVEELLRLLQDRGDIRAIEGRWTRKMLPDIYVPPGLRDFVLDRTTQLSPDARQLVEAASVAGQSATPELLGATAGLTDDQLEPALSSAASRAVLVETESGRYGFSHLLARDAVYGSIPSPLRRRMHLQAARYLEQEEEPTAAELAYHFQQGGQIQNWVIHAERAADLARSVADDATACEFLRDALEAPRLSLDLRVRLLSKLGEAALYAGGQAGAIAAIREVIETERLAPSVEAELRLTLGRLYTDSDLSACRVEVLKAVPHLDDRPDLLTNALRVLAQPWVTEGTLDEHFDWLAMAMELAYSQPDPLVRMKVEADRIPMLLWQGNTSAWADVVLLAEHDGSSKALRELTRANSNLAMTALVVGDYARADRFIRAAEDMARPIDNVGSAVRATAILLDWVTGRWHSQLNERAEQLGECEDDPTPSRAEGRLVRALLLIAQGQVLEAEPILTSDIEVLKRAGSIPQLGMAAAGLARIQLARGEVPAALRSVEDAFETISAKNIWSWASEVAPMAVAATLASGDLPRAEEIAHSFLEGSANANAPLADAAAVLCRAHLATDRGDIAEALELYLRAAQQYRDLPRPYDAALATESAGMAAIAFERPRGLELLGAARESLSELTASWDANRVGKTLRDHGITLPNRGGRRGFGSELSPREREVADLAASGLSNKEIAELLFLSPWTVSRHVSSVLRKLELDSRHDLAGVS